MSLKDRLKKRNLLRRMVKRIKIYREFYRDAAAFGNYYLEEAMRKGDFRYKIMLLVHSIEKGMCMDRPRPFGAKKVGELRNLLEANPDENGFEFCLGCQALKAWADFFKEHGWEKEEGYEQVQKFLENCKVQTVHAGQKRVYRPGLSEENSFCQVLFSRYSARKFQKRELEEADIRFALDCFLRAPTACNRQMCKVYQIKNIQMKHLLDETVMGISGFDKDTVHYFVITYDIAAFEYYGERNQGYLNAGLASMNFVNGLHARGIGSCFLQWSNRGREDKKIRHAMRIPDSERIAVLIGAGYYPDISTVPCSCRKRKSDIFTVLE